MTQAVALTERHLALEHDEHAGADLSGFEQLFAVRIFAYRPIAPQPVHLLRGQSRKRLLVARELSGVDGHSSPLFATDTGADWRAQRNRTCAANGVTSLSRASAARSSQALRLVDPFFKPGPTRVRTIRQLELALGVVAGCRLTLASMTAIPDEERGAAGSLFDDDREFYKSDPAFGRHFPGWRHRETIADSLRHSPCDHRRRA